MSNYTHFKLILHEVQFENICSELRSTSSQQYTIQDIILFLHVFRCRLYGLRNYEKKMGEGEVIADELQNRAKTRSGAKAGD